MIFGGSQKVDVAGVGSVAGPGRRFGFGRVPWRGGTLSAGLILLGFLVLLAVVAPWIVSFDPIHQQLGNALAQPGSGGHLLGTDDLGRDVLARTLYAARVDLSLGLGAVLAPLMLGTALGAIAGYFGGLVDGIVGSLIAVIFAFPATILILTMVFVLGPGAQTILVVFTIVGWVSYAQIIRTGTRGDKEREYVVAARLGGLSHGRILSRHVIPNVIGQAVVYATSDMIIVILDIVFLGFLGVGIPAPTPEWGSMIFGGSQYLQTNPLIVLAPTAAIVLTALSLSLIGDGLARRLDVE